jgi:hypothetical protein
MPEFLQLVAFAAASSSGGLPAKELDAGISLHRQVPPRLRLRVDLHHAPKEAHRPAGQPSTLRRQRAIIASVSL